MAFKSPIYNRIMAETKVEGSALASTANLRNITPPTQLSEVDNTATLELPPSAYQASTVERVSPATKSQDIASTGAFTPAIKSYESLGLKYSLGREKGCTDCSRSVNKIMKSATGKYVGDTTLEQRTRGRRVSTPKEGTLVHFDNKKSDTRHVGIMLDKDTMWHFGVSGAETISVSDYQKRYPFMKINQYRDY